MASAPLNWLARIGGAKLNTRKATLVADAINEINRADVNRTTTFNEDGSITEVYTDGYKVTTTFDSDAQIQKSIIKMTYCTAQKLSHLMQMEVLRRK